MNTSIYFFVSILIYIRQRNTEGLFSSIQCPFIQQILADDSYLQVLHAGAKESEKDHVFSIIIMLIL